jgi:hypothetical protein
VESIERLVKVLPVTVSVRVTSVTSMMTSRMCRKPFWLFVDESRHPA